MPTTDVKPVQDVTGLMDSSPGAQVGVAAWEGCMGCMRIHTDILQAMKAVVGLCASCA